MRIAFICEDDNGLDAEVSSRFGRAPYLVIVDLDGKEVKDVKVMENPGAKARSGAAIKVVQKLVNERVEIAVAGAFGPNALAALDEMKIKHFELSGISVREALKKLEL